MTSTHRSCAAGGLDQEILYHYIDILSLMVRIKLFYEKDTEHAGLQTYRFLSEKDLVSSALPIVTTHCSC